MHRDLIEFWKDAPEDPFEALLAHAPVLMQSTDAEGRILKVSAFWSDLVGYTAEELVGTDWRDLLTDASRTVVEECVAPALSRTGRSHGGELEVVTKSGAILPVVHSATLMLDRDGNFARAFSIFFDNRETAEARRRLAEIAREAEEASRAKSRFLAAMSHEIRTPLNAIMGFAQLLELSNLDDKRRGHVKAIVTAGHSLMNLLTDLLDLSQVEEGKMRIEPRDFDLHDLLDQVADWWHSSAKQKGLRLVVSLDRGLPRRITADPVRLQQVLNNFLGNAVKFTSEGAITLRVSERSREGGLTRLRFEVEDTGPGMTPEQQAKLFRPFVQIESDFGKDRGGWGLGLSICANIAKRLGGEIGVQSRPHEGSIFFFEMDAPVAGRVAAASRQVTAEPESQPQDGPKLRVLLAEDNPPNQDLMRLLLTDLGHEVVAVDNGFEAVAATMRDSYDLVVMDIMMPGLDGLGAAAQIHSSESPVREVPIIACSAHVADEARRRYLAAGMNAFLPKPIDREELRHVIGEVMRGRADSAQGAGA
jgi:two-component system sensor histidine kinase/response regulator